MTPRLNKLRTVDPVNSRPRQLARVAHRACAIAQREIRVGSPFH